MSWEPEDPEPHLSTDFISLYQVEQDVGILVTFAIPET